MSEPERCETCRFWRDLGPWSVGSCRRRAPLLGNRGDDCGGKMGDWPTTRRENWCGEWQRKAAGVPVEAASAQKGEIG